MKLHFPGQKEDEKIEFLVRKHWIIYVKLTIFFVTMVGIPVGAYALFSQTMDFSTFTKQLSTLLFLIYLNSLLLITYIRWFEDESDILIVTNERILNIQQISFLHRTVSETELSQIQDVKHVSKGVLPTLLEFGSLEVQTAGESLLIRIEEVVKPSEMSRCIMDLCNQYKRNFMNKSTVS